jgi:N6-L-threonylcarbamoyladenine synthase
VGANRLLRHELNASAHRHRYAVYYPPLEFCTDNGAMIAFAAALRLEHSSPITHHSSPKHGFNVRPRWHLEDLSPAMR